MLNIYQQKNNHHTEEGSKLGEMGEKKPSLNSYVDPTGEFGAKEYKLGVWYVKHKVLLYRLALGGLAVVIVGLWGFSLWQWGSWAIFGVESDRRTEEGLITFPNYTAVHETLKPQDLQIFGTQILSGGVGKSDLVTEVANPNPRLKAEFDYYYHFGGDARTETKQGFVLPGARTLIAGLGVENNFSNSFLVIENLNWKRISPRVAEDVDAWQKERLDFSVEEFKFSSPEEGGANSNVITFKLKNNSPFGYIQPKFYVALTQGGENLAAVLPLELSSWKSLETRSVDLRSFVPNLRATDAIIFPQIDLYDRTVYLAPEK